MSTRDVLLNTIVNMIILFLRLAYRKWSFLKERQTRDTAMLLLNNTTVSGHPPPTAKITVSYSTYRCRLQLLAVQSMSVSPRARPRLTVASVGPALQAAPLTAGATTPLTRLRFVKEKRLFAASNTLLPVSRVLFGSENPPVWHSRVTSVAVTTINILGICGFVATAVTSMFLPDATWRIFALGATLCFCGMHAACYQKQLLAKVCTTFDFLYFSFQITTAHLGLCATFSWDLYVCLSLLSIWLWIHWVMTLDALTPVARRQLHFKIWYALPIVIHSIDILAFFMLDFFYLGTTDRSTPDQLLFSGTIFNRPIKILAIPFVISRLTSVLLLMCHLLWRLLAVKHDSELAMMLGQVEYDYERRHHGLRLNGGAKWTESAAVPSHRSRVLQCTALWPGKTKVASVKISSPTTN